MTYRANLIAALADASAAVASPSGVATGKTRFTILAADGSTIQTMDVDGLTAEFTGLTDAPASATAQLLDTAGTPILEVVSATFVDGDSAPTTGTVNVTPLGSLTATYVTE